jgi:arylsulfatase A-like enzyme
MEKKYNVLVVLSDQHRWCELGCYGNEGVISPHFDAFAGEALRFDNCYSNCPLCVPIRGSLLTGQHAMRHGALGNDLPVRTDLESIADVFNRAGYETGYIGKWHLGGVPRRQEIETGRRLGFRHWQGCNCNHDYYHGWYDDDAGRHEIAGYEPVAQTTVALDFMRAHEDHPWLLWLSWGPPHDPYLPAPGEWLERYPAESIKLRANMPSRLLDPHKGKITAQDFIPILRGYRAHVSALDEQFGRLTAYLKASDQSDNTIVVYVSDHGDMLGSHGLTRKQLPYDESVRVPLLVRHPELPEPAVCGELIGLVDLPVTLAGAAGLAFESETDGEDFSHLFKTGKGRGQDACYLYELTSCHQSEDRGTPPWRGVRTRDYTYALDCQGGPMLFTDNARDPLQQHDLFGESAARETREHLDALLREKVAAYDGFLDRAGIIRQAGLVEEWNRSQREFHRQELPEETAVVADGCSQE